MDSPRGDQLFCCGQSGGPLLGGTAYSMAGTGHSRLALRSVPFFFDYHKAFDSVPHRLLLRKHRDLKVNSYILKWITYLTNKKQYVCVDGSSAEVLPVSSGVPQGWVLGPILFIIYINGITKVALTAGNLSLFANNILLYRPIQNIEDFAFLQNGHKTLFLD